MFWNKKKQKVATVKAPKALSKTTAEYCIVNYGNHYRIQTNFNNVRFSAIDKIAVDPDKPSRLAGYEHLTAGEAYKQRVKEAEGQRFIALTERERITTVEQADLVIARDLTKLAEGGTPVDKVTVKHMTVQEWALYSRERARRRRYLS